MTKDLSPLQQYFRTKYVKLAAIDAEIMADIEETDAELLSDLRSMEPTQQEEAGAVITGGVIVALTLVISVFLYSTFLMLSAFL